MDWKKAFFAFFVATCSLLFLLNIFHLSQQVIYAARYVPLAENILAHLSYMNSAGEIASYPMWGYAILIAFTNGMAGANGIFAFQYLLLLLSFFLIAQLFALPTWRQPLNAIVFYGALLFYTMLLSVKWPAAIVGFLLLAFAVCHHRKHFVLAAGVLLIAYNFRAEGLGLWVVYLLYLLGTSSQRTSKIWPQLLIVVAILIAPWPSYQYYHHKELTLTSTNSGAVLYMSLGQLPDNPWNRVYDDHAVQAYADTRGVEDPWGYEGNAMLKQEFFADVKKYPASFLKKILYNYYSLIRGGLYVSELRTLTVRGDKERDQQQKELAEAYSQAPGRLIGDLFAFRADTWLLAMQLGFTVLSVLFLISALGLLIWRLATGAVPFVNPYLWLIVAQLGLAGLVQYEPRHMSGVLVLFIFALCPFAKSRQDGEPVDA